MRFVEISQVAVLYAQAVFREGDWRLGEVRLGFLAEIRIQES